MTQELDNKQKKEWAKLLFLTTDLTQAEIAVKIGVSRITIVRWAKEWEGLKLNFLQTREARIKSTLMQLNELDESIAAREQGARYPTVKEADIRRKLTADLEALEPPCGTLSMCQEIFSTMSELLTWRRPRCSRTISIHTYRNG